jgi:hypothetical protein
MVDDLRDLDFHVTSRQSVSQLKSVSQSVSQFRVLALPSELRSGSFCCAY